MQKPIFVRRATVTTLCIALSLLTITPSASAQDRGPRDHEVTGRTQHEWTIAEDKVQASEIPSDRGRGASMRSKHARDSIRMGIREDARNMKVYSVQHPGDPAGRIETVLPADLEIGAIYLGTITAEVEGEPIGKEAVGIQVDPVQEISGDQTVPPDVDELIDGGSGYGSMTLNGFKAVSQNCYNSNVYSTMAKGTHVVRQCYEKIRIPGTNEWIYNRWDTITRADYSIMEKAAAGIGGLAHLTEFTDVTLRTKPWIGTSNSIRYIKDMAPHGTVARDCQASNVGLAWGAVSFGTNFTTGCSEVTGSMPDNKQFRLYFHGTEPNRTVRMDAYGHYLANGNVTPRFTDYLFFEISDTVLGIKQDQMGAWKITDGGWY